jgi:tetrapyrrole methylase family protein / MazG family protein
MPHDEFNELIEIMARLRGPGGCPWDSEQTHDSLKRHLIEESYETVEAINGGDDAHLKEELGDLLLQIVFHAQIAEDRGAFTIDDVIAGLNEKLKRRHPHIYGDAEADTADDVVKGWEAIKAGEGKYDESLLAGIPVSLPSLMKAYKIQKKLAGVGFDWPDTDSLMPAVDAEIEEFKQALAGDGDIPEEIGDILFMLANVARLYGVEPEGALTAANKKVEARFRLMEKYAAEAGRKLNDMTLDEQELLWERAKREIASAEDQPRNDV